MWMPVKAPYWGYSPTENWTMEEEWRDKDCSATNMRWNQEGLAVWEMISLGLTAGEMLLTSLIPTVIKFS